MEISTQPVWTVFVTQELFREFQEEHEGFMTEKKVTSIYSGERSSAQATACYIKENNELYPSLPSPNEDHVS